jgi:hypothetical protein
MFSFFKDLQARLRDLGRGDGGFFAAGTIETGEDWKDELVDQLERCHVIVPLYSPNYFKSPHCGREWKVYYDRFQENKVNPPPDVQRPDIILPVLWTSELLELPEQVGEVQDKIVADYPKVYSEFGLSYMMRSPSKTKYEEFVHKFGRRLAEMLRAQGGQKARPVPLYDRIDPIFPHDSKRGLTFVRYVFMAGLKVEMAIRRQNWDGYGIYADRNDLRPCYPDVDRKAGEIGSKLAAAAGKTFEFIEPGEKLLDRLRYAKELENIVVIVVDPWSTDVPSLKPLLGKIDHEPLPNSALLVMWNRPNAAAPHSDDPGEPHFETRESRKEHIVTVSSHDEFQQKLASFFNTLREAMVASGKIRPAGGRETAPQPILAPQKNVGGQ